MARIDHYEFGRIVVDGREETRDLIILPDRVVRDWWRQDGHALVVDDLGEVLDELPSHLVVGTGANGRMRPDPDTVRQLQERGMTVEVLPTGQAVRRFGELDSASTAAAFHLTC
ncbi:MAG: Mth938-like domain-containing protein [Nocardioidaceae bacterium]